MTETPKTPAGSPIDRASETPASDHPGLLPGGVTEADLRVTPTELATYLRLSRQTVHAHKKAGLIRFDADGRAPLARARRDYQANVDHAKAPRRAGPVPADVLDLQQQVRELQAERARLLGALDVEPADTGTGLNEQRAELLKLQAERARLALAREAGAVLERADVERAIAHAITTARVHLQDLPWRVVQHLDCTDEQRDVLAQQLAQGVDAVLWNLSRAFAELDDGKHREVTAPEAAST